MIMKQQGWGYTHEKNCKQMAGTWILHQKQSHQPSRTDWSLLKIGMGKLAGSFHFQANSLSREQVCS